MKTNHTKDENGHKVNPDGTLDYNEKCSTCKQNQPDEQSIETTHEVIEAVAQVENELRDVSKVVDSLEPIWTEADVYETENGYPPLIPARELAIKTFTEDRKAVVVAVCGVLDGIKQRVYNDISFQKLHAKGNHGEGMVDAYTNTLGFIEDAKAVINNLLDDNK